MVRRDRAGSAQEGARAGDWVQIEDMVLGPGERAPQVPKDTQEVPLIMRVKGFALTDAAVGDTITIKTVTDRRVEGTLVSVNPYYDHDFGRVVPELLEVGLEARRILAGIKTPDGDGGGS